jgi:queuosine precursor transporter
MKKLFCKENFYSILVGLFIGALLIANVLAGRIWTVVGDWTLSGGVFIFPIVFIANDILAEVYGTKLARKAIYLGFIMNVLAVLFFTLINALPNPVWSTDMADAYKMVLGTTWRALAASMLAYLAGNIMNTFVMGKMKQKHGKKLFKTRAIISTIIGELLDSLIFVIILFVGVMDFKQLAFMIILQVVVKCLLEAAVLPITQLVVKQLEKE